jgi:hypothetical protein
MKNTDLLIRFDGTVTQLLRYMANNVVWKVSSLLYIALLSSFLGCNQSSDNTSTCACNTSISDDDTTNAPTYTTVKGALLGTRFTSFEELKSVIQIEYHNGAFISDSTVAPNAFVSVRHCSGGKEVTSILKTGITQGDLHKAGYSDAIGDRLTLLLNCPFAVENRKDLESVFMLSRWKPDVFGEGDPAFFDLAKTSVEHINTPYLAFKYVRDSTEKGYFNTFNHMTAQALITSCFSEELADFIADVHERQHCPALITGKFTTAQIIDKEEGALDNYVDLVNNEWGQEIGKQLKKKYNIHRETNWTPELLTDYMNDLLTYFSWSFQIGFKPFRPENEVIIRFTTKLNMVMNERSNFTK